MIILKHLTVERFRLLREINLHFPQRGSILIQGPNEAGKSTLFESIYFALYGESLAIKRKRSSQGEEGRYDDLILYGETQATVTLALTIGPTELTVVRSIERGKGQAVTLKVYKLGMPEEELVTNLEAANARIIAEIGRIDGATLRNSCFIEQKALSRLEHLGGSEREDTVRKVLGLEKLNRLSEQFKVTGTDERLLAESVERLKLAEVQNRIPDLSSQLGQLEAALDAVTIREDLDEISRQEPEIAEQELALEELAHKRAEIKSQQSRAQQLEKAQSILDELIAAYDTIAEAQRELPELEHQLTDIERREREDLPALEQRVRGLSELSRSFGTLERMAADLLDAVNAIKELKQDERMREQLVELDEEVMHIRMLIEETQQSQYELEEQHRSTRPQTEARLRRLRALSERLTVLGLAEQTRANRIASRSKAEENSAELAKVQAELQETEHELALVEQEAQQVQQRADAVEKRWQQLSIHRQLEEWQRVKGLSQGLTDTEQHVMAAHQQQEQLTLAALAIRRTASIQLGLFIACVVLLILCGGAALIEVLRQSYVFATIAGVAALLLLAGAAFTLQKYSNTREKEQEANRQMQDSISRFSMMVAARENAARMGGNHDQLAQIEYEIRSLGGVVPSSVEEAAHLLQQMQAQEESRAEQQQQLDEARNQVAAARNRVNVAMQAVAAHRKEKARLQDMRKVEGWDNIDEKLLDDQETIEHLRSEIATAAGQEGLPIPLDTAPNAYDSADTQPSTTSSTPSDAELHAQVEEAIKSAASEIATLDARMDLQPELAAQLKVHQETLDVLLQRKQAMQEQHERFQAENPTRQLEDTRQQQLTLRDGLRSLQDSLRQRVQALGVAFGQASVSTAEAAARKQLEAVQITLGRKLELQDRHTAQASVLKERQESLSELYRQLAKCSATLGSWIMPPNPFAETLYALHARCEHEMQEANEPGLLSELEQLKVQEGASQAKIELCKHDIEQAQERIAAMLVQRNRPPTKAYTLTGIAAVWPLVGENSPEDRVHLEEQLAAVEEELRQLEQQELELSTRLDTGKEKLDPGLAREHMQQQERSYQTKKHGGLLIDAAIERLMRKILPRTEYYMQQLLPLLTRGHYHDVRLSTEPGDGVAGGGAFQLSVWEPAAAEYISQSDLSGGAADQISLALRLAFAIAVLPREVSAAPGLLVLDEPLSLASDDRLQALVDLVTGTLLSQHFEQIFFVSHSSTFDPAMFPYHIYIDNGLVVENNLPTVSAYAEQTAASTPMLTGANGHANNDMQDGSQAVPLQPEPETIVAE
jgi:DNA repair exonuclease SbcCD ATPase subunit